MNKCNSALIKLGATSLLLASLSACSSLHSTETPHPAFYSLDSAQTTLATPLTAQNQTALPTLVINPSSAAAGFDSARLIYVQEMHKLAYFANSEWVDPPARMLGPLLVEALGKTGAFQAVVLTPGAATGDVRLDTEIIRLQHEFTTQPSRVRFTLRATLVDDKTRRVLGWREFDGYANAASDNPYGGVIAANLVVQTIIQELSVFCAETVRSPLKPQ
jgi:cholesterol transport system auxiliary component